MAKNKAKKRRLLRRRVRAQTPRHRSPLGAAPGTLDLDTELPSAKIFATFYDADTLIAREIAPEELQSLSYDNTLWLDIRGHDPKTLATLGERFGLHPLTLEDVANAGQRPKVEDYQDHLFICGSDISLDEAIHSEQVSIFLMPDAVISIQGYEKDLFAPLRTRLQDPTSRIRKAKADYLTYALLDRLVDALAPPIDTLGDRLEALESAVFAATEVIEDLSYLRRDFHHLRRVALPMRALLEDLQSPRLSVFSSDTRVFLRDCHDHAIRAMEAIDDWREFASNLMDIHLAITGQKLNAIMKVLTIMSTIFIPLSFLAGLWGMNFDGNASPHNMPELRWQWGYPLAIALMLSVAFIQIAVFWYRGWIGKRKQL